MKPGKTFKLSKTTKRRMATMVNAEQRNAYKRMMIEAEVLGSVVKSKKEQSSK